MEFGVGTEAEIKQTTIEGCEVVLPTKRRRLIMLAVAALLGGVAAYTFPNVIGWSGVTVAVLGLAMLAGISSLWSP